eukprot:m.15778 g.15778  ORF g.15778 m.15778 type:complete len:275 (+) comp5482_c0_seq1:133-957(+)
MSEMSEGWPLDKIGVWVLCSTILFSIARVLVYLFMRNTDFAKRGGDVDDICNKITSSLHVLAVVWPAVTTYTDPKSQADPLHYVCDSHFVMGSISCGFFIYDTIVLWVAPSEAFRSVKSKIEMTLHHMAALCAMPIGLVLQTAAWYGSACVVCMETPTFFLNNIAIMKALRLNGSPLFAANGTLFMLAFFIFRIALFFQVIRQTLGDYLESPDSSLTNPVPLIIVLIANTLWILSILWFPRVFQGFLKEAKSAFTNLNSKPEKGKEGEDVKKDK